MSVSIERKLARLTNAIERERHFLRLLGIEAGPRLRSAAKLVQLLQALKSEQVRQKEFRVKGRSATSRSAAGRRPAKELAVAQQSETASIPRATANSAALFTLDLASPYVLLLDMLSGKQEVFVDLDASKLSDRQLKDEMDGVLKYIEVLEGGVTLREGGEPDALQRAKLILHAVTAEVEKRNAHRP